MEPQVWNHVRRAVDERKEPGQFVLAGSAVPADDATRHSGAGRISRLRMRPMSLFKLSCGGHKKHTVAEYLAALERLFVVEVQPPWEPHLRSRSILRKSSKRHFVDPSLAVAALGANLTDLLRDLNLLGFLFESLVIRDLRIYTQSSRGEVRQYLDNKGLEVDAIVELDGRWAAFEVKLGGEAPIEEAAGNLLKFASEIDSTRSGEPTLLGAIVAGGYAYVREDGVQVIPIPALGP